MLMRVVKNKISQEMEAIKDHCLKFQSLLRKTLKIVQYLLDSQILINLRRAYLLV